MQVESDKLCREYGLSVIEEPKRGKSKHYGEWRAEKEGRQTWRSLLKDDVDTAIRQSMTERQFFDNLRKMGYEVKSNKYISVRPPGKNKFFRLYTNFGEDYSAQAIRNAFWRKPARSGESSRKNDHPSNTALPAI